MGVISPASSIAPHHDRAQHHQQHAIRDKTTISPPEGQIEAEWFSWFLLEVLNRFDGGKIDAEEHHCKSHVPKRARFFTRRVRRVWLDAFILFFGHKLLLSRTAFRPIFKPASKKMGNWKSRSDAKFFFLSCPEVSTRRNDRRNLEQRCAPDFLRGAAVSQTSRSGLTESSGLKFPN